MTAMPAEGGGFRAGTPVTDENRLATTQLAYRPPRTHSRAGPRIPIKKSCQCNALKQFPQQLVIKAASAISPVESAP